MEFFWHLRASAFDGLDATGYKPDLQGWVNAGFDACLAKVTQVMRSRPGALFLEVGSWKGASACRIAEAFKSAGVQASIICIDTWLGAPEFWTSAGLNDPTRGISLARVNGYPSVFYTFTKNVKAMGHSDMIAPLPLSSTQAADVLASYGLKARGMYIDGAHEYEAVLADLATYYKLLEPGGIMWGDDYDRGWPGVVRAVDEFAARHKLKLVVEGSNWVLA